MSDYRIVVLTQLVARYNSSDTDYYIEITEYASADYRDTLDARALQFQTGRGADIILLENDYRLNSYIEKGVLAP